MGDTLSPEVLEAFTNQLAVMQKEAGVGDVARRALGHVGGHSKDFLGNVQKSIRRLDPTTWGEAWREMGRGTKAVRDTAGKVTQKGTGQVGKLEEFSEGVRKGRKYKSPGKKAPLDERAKAGLKGDESGFKEYGKRLSEQKREGRVGAIADRLNIPKWVGREGTHMYEGVGNATPLRELLSKPKGMFEELSRRGWTGKGRITKYMPMGSKGMMAGFTAANIPGIANAPKATPTGEGSTLERGLGELGGVGGMIAGTGVGMIPGMALWGLGQYAGSRTGRTLDRLRSGASLPQAALAPSPQEANAQLQKIQRYYG